MNDFARDDELKTRGNRVGPWSLADRRSHTECGRRSVAQVDDWAAVARSCSIYKRNSLRARPLRDFRHHNPNIAVSERGLSDLSADWVKSRHVQRKERMSFPTRHN